MEIKSHLFEIMQFCFLHYIPLFLYISVLLKPIFFSKNERIPGFLMHCHNYQKDAEPEQWTPKSSTFTMGWGKTTLSTNYCRKNKELLCDWNRFVPFSARDERSSAACRVFVISDISCSSRLTSASVPVSTTAITWLPFCDTATKKLDLCADRVCALVFSFSSRQKKKKKKKQCRFWLIPHICAEMNAKRKPSLCWDSLLVRVPDLWSKGCEFRSLQEWQENFLLS